MDPKGTAISPEQLAAVIHRRLGLIIGPGITLGDGAIERIHARVWKRLAPTELDNIGTSSDLLRQGIKPDAIRDAIATATDEEPHQPLCDALASHRWAAVMTTAIDNRFERKLRLWSDSQPTRPDVSVITDLKHRFVPVRTIPVFKLLGSVLAGDLAVTSVERRIRLTLMPQLLRAFADYVRGSGVLCVGLGEESSLLADLFAPILTEPSLFPGPLLFIGSDPASSCDTLGELEQSGLKVQRVTGDLGTILKRVQEHAKSGFTLQLPFSNARHSLAEQLQAFSDLVAVVPDAATKKASVHTTVDQLNRLRELLFSPSIPNWEPFGNRLDFCRTITATIIERVKSALIGGYWSDFEIRVEGASSVGKTTTLKRVAFDLAADGRTVLWVRHYPFQDGPVALRQLFEVLKTNKKINDVIVFADDPLGLGTIRLDDIRAALRAADLRAVLITGVRSADVATNDADLEFDPDYATDTVVVPDIFDDAEWRALPQYLVQLGINKDLAEATANVLNAPGRAARDVLSMLYYLLPETQARITRSVRDEYLRLGDRDSLRRIIVGELDETSGKLKKAYEYVAVATKYRAPLPIEVLVSALGMNYGDWLAASEGNGLTFGLFYQEQSQDAESVTYRTRNDVVSDIIVTALNGGVVARGGELSHLRTLLSACNGSAPAYRDFCLRVLVPARDDSEHKPAIARLEHKERLSLFEAAIHALPADDPTLLHHMGLAQGKAGDTAGARATLDRALKAKPYPYSPRGEAPEHIHTSHASNELRAIRNGEVDPEQGRKNALHHLERASSPRFFNPNAIHQKALLVAELADLTSNAAGAEDADWFDMIGWALGDLDRAILQLTSDYASAADKQHVKMLEHAREQVLDRLIHLGDAITAAEQLWLHHASQDGFAVVARRLFGIAVREGKDAGSEYKKAFEFCEACAQRILEAGEQPSANLMETMLHIYLWWQIRRRVLSQGTSEIRWEFIHSIAERLIKAPRSFDQPFYHYLVGFALAHLGKWPQANLVFQELRKRQIAPPILHEPRDFLMNPMGGMRSVQGVITSGAHERYLKVDELKTEVRTARIGQWPNDGEIAHAFIRFSYAGPLAVDEP